MRKLLFVLLCCASMCNIALAEQVDGYQDIQFTMSERDLHNYIKSKNFKIGCHPLRGSNVDFADFYTMFNGIKDKEAATLKNKFIAYFYGPGNIKPICFDDDNSRTIDVHYANGKICAIGVNLELDPYKMVSRDVLIKSLSEKYGNFKPVPGGFYYTKTLGARGIAVFTNTRIVYLNLDVLSEFVRSGALAGTKILEEGKTKSLKGL